MKARIAALEALSETHPRDQQRAFSLADRESSAPEREVRAAAAHAVAATGDAARAIEILIRLGRDPDVGVRMEAAVALAGTPWKGRIEPLAEILHDEDLGVAAVAADGLAHAGDRRAAPLLNELLDVRKLRFQAMEGLLALREISLENVAKRLFSGLLVPPFERALAAVVLARNGDESARRYLLEKATKQRAEERPFVIVHLLSCGEPGLKFVRELAAHDRDYLRESAALVLARADAADWPVAEKAFHAAADGEPEAAAEVLLGLFDIDWKRAAPLAVPHAGLQDDLGMASRRVRLATALRERAPDEVLSPPRSAP